MQTYSSMNFQNRAAMFHRPIDIPIVHVRQFLILSIRVFHTAQVTIPREQQSTFALSYTI